MLFHLTLSHVQAQAGYLNRDSAALEVLTAIKRAGADIMIMYFAKDVALSWPGDAEAMREAL